VYFNTLHPYALFAFVLLCAEFAHSQPPLDLETDSTDLACTAPLQQNAYLDRDVRSNALQLVETLSDRGTSRDDGEAIAAEWYRLEIAMIHKLVNVSRHSGVVQVPDMYASRFLGFVEGRLHVALPQSWQQCVLKCTLLCNGFLLFPSQEYSPWRKEAADDMSSTPSRVPAMRVYVEGNDVNVSVSTGLYRSAGGDGDITLPSDLSAKLISAQATSEISSVLFHKDDVFIAVMSDRPVVGTLYCISKGTRKIRWTLPIVIVDPEMNWKGVTTWYTELRLHDDSLVLFHCCELGIGVEGVSIDGQKLFSFSSARLPITQKTSESLDH
jgi:hypothetical protein